MHHGVYVGPYDYAWAELGAGGDTRPTCDGGSSLPSSYTDQCVCDPGSFVTVSSGSSNPSCQPCPKNTFSDGKQTSCTSCGQYQVPIYSYQKSVWTESSIEATCVSEGCLSSSCYGDCNSGWYSTGSYVTTGPLIGQASSQLIFNKLDMDYGAQIDIVCALNCNQANWDQCQLSFTIINSTGFEVDSFNCTKYAWDVRSFDMNGTPSWTAPYCDYFTVTAEFIQMKPATDPTTLYEARIYSFTASPVNFGGAVSCSSCPLGHYFKAGSSSLDATCEPCPAGQESTNPPSDHCIACTGNNFNPQQGKQCMACGNGTTALPGNLACDIHGCSFTGQISKRLYNYSALSHPGGSMVFAGETEQFWWQPQMFYINPCSASHTNTSCFDVQGNPYPYMSCQITQDAVFDLGSVVGFWENALGDVTMQFIDGSYVCE